MHFYPTYKELALRFIFSPTSNTEKSNTIKDSLKTVMSEKQKKRPNFSKRFVCFGLAGDQFEKGHSRGWEQNLTPADELLLAARADACGRMAALVDCRATTPGNLSGNTGELGETAVMSNSRKPSASPAHSHQGLKKRFA